MFRCLLLSATFSFLFGGMLGCAARGQIEPIGPGTTVAVYVIESDLELPDAKHASEAVVSEAASGMGKGAVVGMELSQACGWAALFCVPYFAGGGMIIGGLAGAIHGQSTALSKEDAKAIEEILRKELLLAAPLIRRLLAAFVELSSSRWEINSGAEYPRIGLAVDTSNNIKKRDR